MLVHCGGAGLWDGRRDPWRGVVRLCAYNPRNLVCDDQSEAPNQAAREQLHFVEYVVT